MGASQSTNPRAANAAATRRSSRSSNRSRGGASRRSDSIRWSHRTDLSAVAPSASALRRYEAYLSRSSPRQTLDPLFGSHDTSRPESIVENPSMEEEQELSDSREETAEFPEGFNVDTAARNRLPSEMSDCYMFDGENHPQRPFADPESIRPRYVGREQHSHPHTPPSEQVGMSPSWVPPVLLTDGVSFVSTPEPEESILVPETADRRTSSCSSGSSVSYSYDSTSLGYEEDRNPDFFPSASRNYEWMGRSIETLALGHAASAPILCLPEDDNGSGDESTAHFGGRRRSTVSTIGSEFRRGSMGSIRGSLTFFSGGPMHGGTMANYHNRRRPIDMDRGGFERAGRRNSASHGPSFRRRSSINVGEHEDRGRGLGGPNVIFSLLARETTGKNSSLPGTPAALALRAMGGHTLFAAIDKPSGGMSSEVAFLSEAIDNGDWSETQAIISRLAPRLIGDPSMAHLQASEGGRAAVEDPSLPPSTSPYYAGGGRLGLERDAFVLSGGVEVLIRIFREPRIVGEEMAKSYDARDLSQELVATRLATCWNEVLASLRELIYAIPSLVETGVIFDHGEFVPFLFTLLSHDSCFDGAAALIEEILSLQSHSSPPPSPTTVDGDSSDSTQAYPAIGRITPATTFFLGNVPHLYRLWRGFNCRQLAHFCRILALLVFEPEDRQLLESPAVLKSLELLQLRRNRAARAGRDSTVDMNQAILLGDEELTTRLLKLLRVMNFAPTVRRSASYHVMSHFPFVADTLVMLGVNELEDWGEIDRLEVTARKFMTSENRRDGSEDSSPVLSELGSVADMLDSLSQSLSGNSMEPPNQLSHIIQVINAAQQAGVFVGRPRQSRPASRSQAGSQNSSRDESDSGEPPDGVSYAVGAIPVGGGAIQDLTTAAGMLGDQVLARRFYTNMGPELDDNGGNVSVQVVGIGVDGMPGREFGDGAGRNRIYSARESANILQFNGILLGPYQVEVLFVLCTLLGGRRKINAQEILNRCGLIPILDDMFHRLPWGLSRHPHAGLVNNSHDGGSGEDGDGQQGAGIHGPGCECTPESALCVQYLRLLHNFCDRDCDNYAGRRLLLSRSEQSFIFSGANDAADRRLLQLEPGLLSKVIGAFIRESDESPYRFWLASCIESYLRGSSPAEQIFAARSGLMPHLIEDITSERLHCAGSLQTSFDLLGELCKGNAEVLRYLVSNLNEESFRKLMSVAAANLVDSNVFIRSLILSLERLSAANGLVPIHIDSSHLEDGGKWNSERGTSRAYLTHTWWDPQPISLDQLERQNEDEDFDDQPTELVDGEIDDSRLADWFPTTSIINAYELQPSISNELSQISGLNESVGHFGWVFSPIGDSLANATHAPNTLERLSWFLAANQTRLLRDLLGVVDLRNINHENICCLNTAVVIAIFAHRRQQLSTLLSELRQMNDEEIESKRRAVNAAAAAAHDDIVDRAFVQAMRYMELDQETPPYTRRASLRNSVAHSNSEIGDRSDVMRNFREVLWFWFEYYTHRGRDRLSLEFSSHLRFQEWNHVVSLLGADDGSPASLVQNPVRLPRSPYQRAARIADNPLRGV